MKTILLIEDDLDIQDNLGVFLRSEGYQVISAYHGREGLVCLQSTKGIDVILLDLMMPVMNGYEFLRAMNSEQFANIKRIPVVLLSATNEIEKFDRSQEVHFLKKPLDLDLLLNAIEM